MITRNYKKIMFGLIVVGLWIPIIHNVINFPNLPDLKGSFTIPEQPELRLDSFISGEFQTNFNEYYKSDIEFNKGLIRLYNQIDYSIFQTTNTSVAFGENGYLFSKTNVADYYGQRYVDPEVTANTVNRLKLLQDKLKSLDTELLVVISPNKTWYYPELIPSTNNRYNRNTYQDYTKGLESAGVQHVDLNEYLRLQKSALEYEPFAQCSVHWNDYGMALGINRVVAELESITGSKSPHLTWEDEDVRMLRGGVAYELAKSMNLATIMDCAPTPNIKFAASQTGAKPKTLFIHDSFFWRFNASGITDSIFDIQETWYYNRQLRVNGETTDLEYTAAEVKRKYAEHDVVILLFTVNNSTRLDNLILNDMCERIFPELEC